MARDWSVSPSRKFYDVLKVMTSIDITFGVVIPCLAIIVMNAGIGIKLCRYTNRATSGTKVSTPLESLGDTYSNFSSSFKPMGASVGLAEREGTDDNSVVKSQQQQDMGHKGWRVLTRRRHTQRRITRALFIVSSVFLILNAPSYAFRIQALVLSLRNEALDLDITVRVLFWRELLQFLQYVNFAGNFFIYSACSRNFRNALKRLLRRAYTSRRRCLKLKAAN